MSKNKQEEGDREEGKGDWSYWELQEWAVWDERKSLGKFSC